MFATTGLSGLQGLCLTDFPPAGTAGQTLAWRLHTTQTTSTITTSAGLNTKYYSGNAVYLRRKGPRYGPYYNPTWQNGGMSVRVPYGTSGSVKTNIKVDVSSYTSFKTIGMFGGWFKFSNMTVSFKRLFGTRTDGGTATSGAPDVWASIRYDGTDIIAAKVDSAGGTNTDPTAVGKMNQWIWLSICVYWTGAAYKWRLYYKNVGTSMTQIGSESSYGGDRRQPIVNIQSTNDASLDDVTNAGGWSGTIAAFSGYSLASQSDGFLYPNDIVEPTDDVGDTWYVSASAAGGGDGTTPGLAWTEAELHNEISYGTLRGSYKGIVDLSGNAIASPTTQYGANTYRDNVEAGLYTNAGDTLSISGTITQTRDIGVETIPGFRLTGSGTLNNVLPLTGTFTQPDSVGHPNVWQKTGANFTSSRAGIDGLTGATVIIDGYRYTPVGAANLAAAYATLDNVKRSYADSNAVYFNSVSDPNSDGLTRYYVSPLLVAAGLSTTGGQVIISTGMIDNSVTIAGGPLYAHQAVSPDYIGLYNVGVVNGEGQQAIVRGNIAGGSNHSVCFTGGGTAGMLVLGGTFTKAHNNTYTAYTTSGSAGTGIYTRALSELTETNCHPIGQQISTTPNTITSVYTHNNGAAVQQFGTFADYVMAGGGEKWLGIVNITSVLELDYQFITSGSYDGGLMYLASGIIPLAGVTGYTCTINGTSTTLSYWSGNPSEGTSPSFSGPNFTLGSPSAYAGDSILLNYSPGNVTNALNSVAMRSFTGMAITNAAPALVASLITTATSSYSQDGKALKLVFQDCDDLSLSGSPSITIKDDQGATIATEADIGTSTVTAPNTIEIQFNLTLIANGDIRTFTYSTGTFTYSAANSPVTGEVNVAITNTL